MKYSGDKWLGGIIMNANDRNVHYKRYNLKDHRQL